MSAMNSFNNTFFMSGPEGGILIAICIVAAVCTLAVIALAIIAVLALRRRKRENEGEVSEPAQKVQPPAEQAEQTEQTSAEVLAETPSEIPAELSEQTHTKVSSAIFAQGGVFYNKSFKAKLIQSGDKVKSWYAALKNELLSYKKVKARMSWKRESFRFGRKIIARFGYRGNTLCIYLPLEPADYQGTKYKVEASDYAAYADTPCMYRIKNERRVRYAAELIAVLMGSRGIERIERMAEDYYLPYEDAETLIKEGLIKVVNVPPRQIASWDAAEEGVEEIAAEATGEAAEEVSEEPVAEKGGESRTVLPFDRNATQYIRSFAAKLIQSDDEVKNRYAELRNQLLAYRRVKMRRSWKRESYRLGRKNVVRLSFRGKTLCAYFALNPNEFEESKYKVESVESIASYADTPCMYRIKNERRVRYAKDLIAMVMKSADTERNEGYVSEDYYLPYEQTEALIEKRLIKVVNITPNQIISQDSAEEVVEEIAAEAIGEVAGEEVSEEQLIDEVEVLAEEENAFGKAAEQEQPLEETEAEEEAITETPEENPVKEAEGVSGEQLIDEVEIASGEGAVTETIEEEPTEETIIETEVEELSKRELDDVETYEEKTKDEDGIEVVGVMFRRRGRKVYWFDPDGKTWEKGEIAFYITPDVPPQEVIIVDNAKISPSKLHLPLKPLHKATRRPQINKK